MPIVALGLTLHHNMVMPEGVEVVGFFFLQEKQYAFYKNDFLRVIFK